MKKTIAIIGTATLLIASALTSRAQSTNSVGSFFGTVQSYFTSFNTNLDTTFASERGSIWTGVDSIQGGSVALANCLGASYKVYKGLSLESVTRNSGIAGTVVSEQSGLGLNFVIHDTKLTGYADFGYALGEAKDKLYGELGLRVQKALTEHTFAGVSVGAQLPANRQVFSAFAGFTF